MQKIPDDESFIRACCFIIIYFSFAATEVRCQEKTRGGLCYEVILGVPEVKTNPPKRTSSPTNKNVSAQDIEEKLKAAEERRQVGGNIGKEIGQ